MVDSKTYTWACPNNRKTRDNSNGKNHWYCIFTHEKNVKKIPDCPYCKAKPKMIEYEKETKNGKTENLDGADP
jgi:hypothetical protein